MTKRQTRMHLFCMLYSTDFHDNEEMPEQIAMYFEQLDHETMQVDREKIQDLLVDLQFHQPAIDEMIASNSEGWTLNRMSKVDLTILRISVYELLYVEEVPEKVAINEAVELSKEYGGEHSRSFVNGILGKIARGLQGEEHEQDC